ncbi:hypothetical protein Peur_055084 [Populus x canadensis]
MLCFSPYKHLITIPSKNWEKLAGNLETLEFRTNPGLIGKVPTSLGSLIRLQSLVLLENNLSGELPRTLWSLPSTFGGLTPLLKLDLSNNQLKGNLPTINNGFSHGLTKSLQEMYYWEEMVLSDNPIGRALEGLEWHGLQNLVVLDLSSMGLTCEIPKFI